MSGFTIFPLNVMDRAWLRAFLEEHWAASFVVAHGVKHDADSLEGFAARRGDVLIGLVTYCFEPKGLEVVTLDSLEPGGGIGSALLEAVIGVARERDLPVWLITTNDNVHALRFYQKRGFTLKALHRNALDVSRSLKPQIGTIGLEGIPLRDEIELELVQP